MKTPRYNIGNTVFVIHQNKVYKGIVTAISGPDEFSKSRYNVDIDDMGHYWGRDRLDNFNESDRFLENHIYGSIEEITEHLVK